MEISRITFTQHDASLVFIFQRTETIETWKPGDQLYQPLSNKGMQLDSRRLFRITNHDSFDAWSNKGDVPLKKSQQGEDKVKSSDQVEPGKRATMNRILAIARNEFSRNGLADARVENIARDAGVTKQLIYHYYGSKENLFVAVLDESSESIMSELVSMNVDHLAPPAALRSMLNRFFDQYRNDPLLGALALEGIRYHDAHETPRNRFLDLAPGLIVKLGGILQRGVASGVFKPVVDTRLFLATAALVTTGWFTNRYSMSALTGLKTDSPESMAIWRKYSADFIMASISAEPNNDAGDP